jgi:hypothetical protein
LLVVIVAIVIVVFIAGVRVVPAMAVGTALICAFRRPVPGCILRSGGGWYAVT